MVADGNGNLTAGTESGSNDGTLYTGRTLTGTYTVNADCTGTAALIYSDNTKSNNTFVLVSGGKEADFAEADTGWVVGGIAKQQ
jgi:hypothetical protein